MRGSSVRARPEGKVACAPRVYGVSRSDVSYTGSSRRVNITRAAPRRGWATPFPVVAIAPDAPVDP
jgi:hypothetical protein